MTWCRLQALVSALLSGDNTLTKDIEGRLALLEYAFEEVLMLADVTGLTLSDQNGNQIRNTTGGYVNRPSLPETDEDEVNIDKGVIFAVARLIASYVSKEKFSLHRKEAEEIIRRFNRAVYSAKDQNNGY